MTVPTQTNKAVFTANGVTTEFPFTFGTLPTADLVVTLIDGDAGTVVNPSDYTVRGAGRDDGGSVVFNDPPASGLTVLIQRLVPYTQPTDYKNQGSFYPRTHERSFDRATMQVQQLAEEVSRSLRIRPDYTLPVSLDLPTPEASRLIGWNADGSALRNTDVSGPADLLLRSDLADPTGGAGLVAFRQAAAGAVARDAGEKLREMEVSMTDFRNASPSDYTDALQAAINFAAPLGRAVAIPDLEFPVLGTVTSPAAVTLQGKGPGARLKGIGQTLINGTSDLRVSGLGIDGFGVVADFESSGSLDRIGFYDCNVTNCASLLRWPDAPRNKTLARLDVQDCTISGFSGFCLWVEAQIQSCYFQRNTVDGVRNYLIRSLFGDSSEPSRSTFHISENKIKNVTSGTATGLAGVARVFQIAADRVWITRNEFRDIAIEDGHGATGNVNILYGDVASLWVIDNDHFDCGKDDPTGYLYQDKGPGDRAYNWTIRGNSFVQSDANTDTYGCIQTTAENTTATENKFINWRGPAFYAGWNHVKNVTYSKNQHLGMRGLNAVRFYGEFENVIHEGNIYDGITNDLNAVESGAAGAFFVWVSRSTSLVNPSWLKSSGNVYRNADPVTRPAGTIVAGVVVTTQGSSGTFDNFTFKDDEFDNMDDGLHFRGGPGLVNQLTIEGCIFNPSVTRPIRFESAYRPTNMVVRNNRGFVTESRGQATIPDGSTSVVISHGLTGALGPAVRVSLTSDGDERVWATGKLSATFNARRAGTTGARVVDWIAWHEP